MKIAIVGKGGREAAIAWKLAQSPKVHEVVVLPGNPGMLASKVSCQDFQTTEDLIQILKQFDLSIVGQEKYLEQGLIDLLVLKGIPCIGPTKAASQLESSKLFCKNTFVEADLPTAGFRHFISESDLKAFAIQEITKRPLVLKWDYLAEGKGVFVCFDLVGLEVAFKGLHALALKQNQYSVVVEDFLNGREFSAFCLVDGDSVKYFSSACDYKRLSADPTSPNTGGMGTYSPADVLVSGEEELVTKYCNSILQSLKRQGIEFNGVMFMGCLQVNDTTYLLEINTRFGDPETQSILPRLSSDLSDIFVAMSMRRGQLKNIEITWSPSHAVHVVKADPNYPAAQKSHVKIYAQDNALVNVFYAGIEKRGNDFYTNGGRVLGLTAMGQTKADARNRVYANLDAASFENEYYRKDIGC
jgi:phosphoribosylamine--glycine ligase